MVSTGRMTNAFPRFGDYFLSLFLPLSSDIIRRTLGAKLRVCKKMGSRLGTGDGNSGLLSALLPGRPKAASKGRSEMTSRLPEREARSALNAKVHAADRD